MKTAVPLLAALLLLAACRRASGPLPQEVYVWQRSWTPEVKSALGRTGGFSKVVFLGAEVDPRAQPPRIAWTDFSAAPLGGPGGRPVGVALRVGAFPGRFADDEAAAGALLALAQELVAETRHRGLSPTELQLDYDCPESKLADYAAFVETVKAQVEVPVTVTALPAWLNQPRAFARLAAAAEGYVLQVHFLDLPRGPDQPLVLCDPRAARRAVEKAARFGRPFRVALPTYGYAVAFDRDGRLLGLQAEGPALSWPRQARVRTVHSDPAAMARLVRDWEEDRPPELTGVLWYRLPVEGDRLNWTWTTLAAVAAGREPRAEVHATLRRPDPGLIEIELVNDGEADGPFPPSVALSWNEGTLLAADALGGYKVERVSSASARLTHARQGAPQTLRPGDRRTIAWLRFDRPTEVDLELVEE